jgi:hypothetical protein
MDSRRTLFEQAAAAELDLLQRGDAAGVERAAARLVAVAGPAGLHDDVAEDLVAAISARADSTAARLLAGLALVADEPIAVRAAEAAGRLGVPTMSGDLGAGRVVKAWRQPIEPREVLWAELEEGSQGHQIGWFLLGGDGPWLLAADLSAPAARERAELVPRTRAEEVPVDAFAAALRAAAAATVASGRTVALTTAAAHLLTMRALGVREPVVLPAREDDVRSPDLAPVMDELLDRMAEWVEQTVGVQSAAWRSGDFVAGAMIEFKSRRKGSVTAWTADDVTAFMVDWFPRTIVAPEGVVRDLPECVAAFLHFLTDLGAAAGDPLPDLELAVVAATPEYVTAVADRDRWSADKRRLVEALESQPVKP